MTERKMATIRIIDSIDPIPDADKIEVCTIGGWKVVSQKGIHQVGNKVIYLEIDSWVPNNIAPFLTAPGHYPKEYNGVKGERLKTVKLRGQVSQGLLLPLAEFFDPTLDWEVGQDVSELLCVSKYEPPVSAQLAGQVLGKFPSFIRKTDQERIQNLSKEFSFWREDGSLWEVTEKLDGSSMTVYIKDGRFGVCSRNLDLKEDENNAFWKVARQEKLEEKLRELCFRGTEYALQGELIGEGVQKNPYKLKGQKFFLFDIWNISTAEYVSVDARREISETYNIEHVPVISKTTFLPETSISDIITLSDRQSMLGKVSAEGLVYKRMDGLASFKAISNKYLLKNDA
jgi:RNA ligase (TIGR02306 family)